ncbi:MAG: AMP-binding protein, partial [Micromonosporaceae bacterium]|nr:AMP-binding protein [Micromonosporaceae bacterium]
MRYPDNLMYSAEDPAVRSHIDGSTLPLSAAQTQVWSAASLYPDDATLNLGNYLDITGPLDTSAIASAVRRAVTEAEALRTTIVEGSAAPRQVITPIGDWSLPVADLRTAAHPDRAAQEWMRGDLRRPFDLRGFPLFRFALLRLADHRHLLYECVHHIAWDGHSWGIYYPRLAELYAAAISGKRVGGHGFPPFRKLLDDEFAWSRSDDAARQQRYWERRFSTAPELVSLSDRALVPAGGRIRRRDRIPPDAAERIRAVAWEARVTWSTAVVAAAAAFTSRMTGRRDVLLTLPVTGRVGGPAHGIPGLRAKHLPLPLSVRPETSRAELLRQTGAELRGALGAQLVPAARLRRILGIPADDPRPYGPSINVLASLGRLAFGPCDGTLHILSNGVVQDLQLNVYDDGSAGFDVYVDANQNLYDAEELATLAQRFVGFLESFAETDAPPARSDLLTPAERRSLAEWNDTEDHRGLDDVVQRVREVAAARPHLVAVADDSGQVRYPELTRQADAVADRVRAAGAAPDEVVAILPEPSSRFVAALLGVLAA